MTFEHLELGTSLLALDGGTILTAGNQNYTTAQTLGGTTILNNTGSNGTAVTFSSTLNGAHGLTINTAGTVTFSRAVGNGTSLASLTVAGGASTVVDGGSIRTTGAQTYSGTVTLGDDTTFRSISGTLTFLGAITGNNRALTINTTGAASSLVSASALSSFTKIGSGTLTLTGQSTYTGTTFINLGTLALGTNQALPATGKLSLAGGTLALQGHAQTLGLLAITASSTINFSTGGTLVFANSSAEVWSGTLTITNYSTATNTFQFSTTSAGLSLAQLANIRFADYGNAPGQISALGIVTPSAIPEPSTYAALLGAAALALAALRRKNRSRSS
jgi:autotransporter-associated beta strand protein